LEVKTGLGRISEQSGCSMVLEAEEYFIQSPFLIQFSPGTHRWMSSLSKWTKRRLSSGVVTMDSPRGNHA